MISVIWRPHCGVKYSNILGCSLSSFGLGFPRDPEEYSGKPECSSFTSATINKFVETKKV